MLSKVAIANGIQVASRLSKEGFRLSAKPNTLLSELNMPFTFVNIGKELSSQINPSSYEEAVEGIIKNINEPIYSVDNSNKKSFLPKDHDILTDNYIDDLKKIVSNHFNFTRNTVNQQAWKFHENFLQAMENYIKEKQPENVFSVTYVDTPEVYVSDYTNMILSTVPKTSNYMITDKDRLNLSSVFTEDFKVIEYITSTMSEEDTKAFSSYLNTIGEATVKSYILGTCNSYAMSQWFAVEYFFVNMLFYQALFSRLDLNIEPSVQSLRIKTDYLRKIFASSFEQNYITMKSYIDKGNMIVDYVNTPFSVFNAEGSFKIAVHNENFKKFIEAGASIETLFGYIGSDTSNLYGLKVSDFNESNIGFYTNKWSNLRNIFQYRLHAEKTSVFKICLLNEFSKFYEEISKEDISFKGHSPAKYDDVTIESVKKYIDEIVNVNLEDEKYTYQVALDIIAGIVYGDTPAWYILSKMKDILESNDNLDASEAAFFAAIEYLTEYLCEQIA